VHIMTITWGDITFDGPFPATNWDPPHRAAVYAIMVKTNDKYRIVYFGESGNLSERGFWRSHHKFECFMEEAGNDEQKLYIGIHLMPNSTEADRKRIEARLVAQHSHLCND
jgi:hypothetical protein